MKPRKMNRFLHRALPLILGAAMSVQIPYTAQASTSGTKLTLEGIDGAKSEMTYTSTAGFDPYVFLTANGTAVAANGLAELSAVMATATYGYDTGVFADSILSGLASHENDTLKLMQECGFANARKRFSGDGTENGHSSKEDNDHGVLYSGTQKLPDGKSVLVGAVINGYSEGRWEWVSNFNIGAGPVHEGFEKAAEEIADLLEDDVKQAGGDRSTARFWITGHSRGAALTNLVALKLIKRGYPANKIFAYGFATPQYTRNVTGKYESCIINYVSPHDFVPYVAPGEWGYGREGKNIIFDNSNTKAMEIQYEKVAGTEYKGYTVDERAEMIDSFVKLGKSPQDYDQEILTSLTMAGVMKPSEYAMYGLGYAMNASLGVKADGLATMINCTDPAAIVLNARLVNGVGANLDFSNKIAYGHGMLAYMEWISLWKIYLRDGNAEEIGTWENRVGDADLLLNNMNAEITGLSEGAARGAELSDRREQTAVNAEQAAEYLRILANGIDEKLPDMDFAQELASIADAYEQSGDVASNKRICSAAEASMHYLSVIASGLDSAGEYTEKIDAVNEKHQAEEKEDVSARTQSALEGMNEYLEIITQELDPEGSFAGQVEAIMAGEADKEQAETPEDQIINTVYRGADLLEIFARELGQGEENAEENADYIAQIDNARDADQAGREADTSTDDKLYDGFCTYLDYLDIISRRMAELMFGQTKEIE